MNNILKKIITVSAAIILCPTWAGAAFGGLNINHYPNDFTFFNSNYIVTAGAKYENTTLKASDGNSIEAEPLDYRNPDKGNRIIMTKNTSGAETEGVYFSTSFQNKSDLYPQKYYYKYYSVEGSFKISGNISYMTVLMLSDFSDPAVRHEQIVMRIQKNTFKISGNAAEYALTENTWYNLRAYADIKNHKLNVYLGKENEELLYLGEADIDEKINNIIYMRTAFTSGTGTVEIKNWDITGLANKPEHITVNGKTMAHIIKGSQFTDESVIENYIKNKVILHGDGKLMCINGIKKHMSGETAYTNDDLYVSLCDFNEAMNTEVSYNAGEFQNGGKTVSVNSPPIASPRGNMLVPAKELAAALGYYAANLDYGSMVMICRNNDLPQNTDKNKPWFDSTFYSSGAAAYPLTVFTDVQEISNYIFYDRPKAEQLKADFNSQTDNGKIHPRLLLTPQKTNNLKSLMQTDTEYAQRVNKYIETAEEKLNSPLPKYEYEDGLRTLTAAQNFKNAVLPLAFAYQITGDSRFAEKVIEDLLAVSEFPDYNPGHVIDMGVWLSGLAIGYDWCFDAMSDAERKAVSDAIIEKGVKTINKAYYGRLSAAVVLFGQNIGASYGSASFFPKWKSNFIGYIQGGVTLAALAAAEDSPEVCFDTIEKSLRAWEYSNFGFYPSGTWLEGKTYQCVVDSNMAMAFGAMLTSMGDTYNVLDAPGVENNLNVLMNLSSYSGSFTYGDDTMREGYEAIGSFYSFFADYYKNDDFLKWRRLKNTDSWMDLIYYKPTDTKNAFDNLGHTFYAEGGEIFTAHENPSDKNALFFAAAGGPTRHYHFHNDGGDFMLCMDGEMWTWEIGQGNYNVGTNYTRYSGRTEAHNTLTINPDENYSQKEQSFAPVIRRAESGGGAYCVLDMTELYEHHGADKVHRGFYIGDDYRSLTVRDEMSFSKQTSGYWFMSSKAQMTLVDDNTISLKKNGKTMLLKAVCDGDDVRSSLSIMEAKPLDTSPKLDGDNTANNPGVTKAAIYFEGSGKINITVRIAPDNGDADTTPIAEWTAPEAKLKKGKTVWTEDFEKYSVGETSGSWSRINSGETFSASVAEEEGNKILYLSEPSGNGNSGKSVCRGVAFDVGNKSADSEKYTVEYKLKLAEDNIKKYSGAVQNLMGLGASRTLKDAYVTMYSQDNIYRNASQGSLTPWSVSVALGEAYKTAVNPQTALSAAFYPYEWNTYRFDVSPIFYKDTDGSVKKGEYARLYINNRYAATLMMRSGKSALRYLTLGFDLQYTDSIGFYIDDITVSESAQPENTPELFEKDENGAWVTVCADKGDNIIIAGYDQNGLKSIKMKTADEKRSAYYIPFSDHAEKYKIFTWNENMQPVSGNLEIEP